MRTLLLLLLAFVLCLLSGVSAFAQTSAVPIRKDNTGNLTENFDIPTGRTVALESGGTLTLAGTVSGTPANGTLNLSGLTLTVPAGLSIGGTVPTAAGLALLDDADATAQRNTLSLGTANSPQFTGIELSHASQNTLTASGGQLSIEGVAIPTISSASTLTNKTLTAPTITSPVLSGTVGGSPTIWTHHQDFRGGIDAGLSVSEGLGFIFRNSYANNGIGYFINQDNAGIGGWDCMENSNFGGFTFAHGNPGTGESYTNENLIEAFYGSGSGDASGGVGPISLRQYAGAFYYVWRVDGSGNFKLFKRLAGRNPATIPVSLDSRGDLGIVNLKTTNPTSPITPTGTSASRTGFTVTGVDTAFLTEVKRGDTLVIGSSTTQVQSVQSNTSLTTLQTGTIGSSGSLALYRPAFKAFNGTDEEAQALLFNNSGLTWLVSAATSVAGQLVLHCPAGANPWVMGEATDGTFVLGNPKQNANPITINKAAGNNAFNIDASSNVQTANKMIAGGVLDAANSVYIGTAGVVFEGSSADSNEGTLAVTNPTGDRIYTLPDATGTVAVGLSATSVLNFDLTAVEFQELPITVTGAVAGDVVDLGPPANIASANVSWCAVVTGTDTVTVRVTRVQGTTPDPPSGTWRATVRGI